MSEGKEQTISIDDATKQYASEPAMAPGFKTRAPSQEKMRGGRGADAPMGTAFNDDGYADTRENIRGRAQERLALEPVGVKELLGEEHAQEESVGPFSRFVAYRHAEEERRDEEERQRKAALDAEVEAQRELKNRARAYLEQLYRARAAKSIERMVNTTWGDETDDTRDLIVRQFDRATGVGIDNMTPQELKQKFGVSDRLAIADKISKTVRQKSEARRGVLAVLDGQDDEAAMDMANKVLYGDDEAKYSYNKRDQALIDKAKKVAEEQDKVFGYELMNIDPDAYRVGIIDALADVPEDVRKKNYAALGSREKMMQAAMVSDMFRKRGDGILPVAMLQSFGAGVEQSVDALGTTVEGVEGLFRKDARAYYYAKKWMSGKNEDGSARDEEDLYELLSDEKRYYEEIGREIQEEDGGPSLFSTWEDAYVSADEFKKLYEGGKKRRDEQYAGLLARQRDLYQDISKGEYSFRSFMTGGSEMAGIMTPVMLSAVISRGATLTSSLGAVKSVPALKRAVAGFAGLSRAFGRGDLFALGASQFLDEATQEDWKLSPAQRFCGAAGFGLATLLSESISLGFIYGRLADDIGVNLLWDKTLAQSLASVRNRSAMSRAIKYAARGTGSLAVASAVEGLEEGQEALLQDIVGMALGITDEEGKEVFTREKLWEDVLENTKQGLFYSPFLVGAMRAPMGALGMFSPRFYGTTGPAADKNIFEASQSAINARAVTNSIKIARDKNLRVEEIKQAILIEDKAERKKFYKEHGWNAAQRRAVEVARSYYEIQQKEFEGRENEKSDEEVVQEAHDAIDRGQEGEEEAEGEEAEGEEEAGGEEEGNEAGSQGGSPVVVDALGFLLSRPAEQRGGASAAVAARLAKDAGLSPAGQTAIARRVEADTGGNVFTVGATSARSTPEQQAGARNGAGAAATTTTGDITSNGPAGTENNGNGEQVNGGGESDAGEGSAEGQRNGGGAGESANEQASQQRDYPHAGGSDLGGHSGGPVGEEGGEALRDDIGHDGHVRADVRGGGNRRRFVTPELSKKERRKEIASLSDDAADGKVYQKDGDVWRVAPAAKARFDACLIPIVDVTETTGVEPAKAIHDRLSALKKAHPNEYAQVDVRTVDDYAGQRLFLAPGVGGFLIDSEGSICSLFAERVAPRGAGHALMLVAIAAGGRSLDHFDTYLSDFYSVRGFEETRRLAWDDQYMPADWDKEYWRKYNDGEPDVVFRKYVPAWKRKKEEDAEKRREREKRQSKLLSRLEQKAKWGHAGRRGKRPAKIRAAKKVSGAAAERSGDDVEYGSALADEVAETDDANDEAVPGDAEAAAGVVAEEAVDKQDTFDAQEEARADALDMADGNPATFVAAVPGEDEHGLVAVTGRYVVVDAGELSPVNDESDAELQEAVRVLLGPDGAFVPQRLLSSPSLERGAPVVVPNDARGSDKNGFHPFVFDGRIQLVRRFYTAREAGFSVAADAYESAVVAFAQKRGIEIPVGCERPVVVRVVDVRAKDGVKIRGALHKNELRRVSEAAAADELPLLDHREPLDSDANAEFVKEYARHDGRQFASKEEAVATASAALVKHVVGDEVLGEIGVTWNPVSGWNAGPYQDVMAALQQCAPALAKLHEDRNGHDLAREIRFALLATNRARVSTAPAGFFTRVDNEFTDKTKTLGQMNVSPFEGPVSVSVTRSIADAVAAGRAGRLGRVLQRYIDNSGALDSGYAFNMEESGNVDKATVFRAAAKQVAQEIADEKGGVSDVLLRKGSVVRGDNSSAARLLNLLSVVGGWVGRTNICVCGTDGEFDAVLAKESGGTMLEDERGQVLGYYNESAGRVVLRPGADVRTVVHELGWHATFSEAKERFPELYEQMSAFAESASAELRAEIEEEYAEEFAVKGKDGEIVRDGNGWPVFDAEGREKILNEIGARMFTDKYGAKFERMVDSMKSKRAQSRVRKLVEKIKECIAKVWARVRGTYDRYWDESGNRRKDVDVDAILENAKDANDVMDRIADAMIKGQVLAGYDELLTEAENERRELAKDAELDGWVIDAQKEAVGELRAYKREKEEIRRKAKADGAYMKAPNGKPTKLTERQWLAVRTKKFKGWFGDWEGDPRRASKAVDPETGEPAVFYHGTKRKDLIRDRFRRGMATSGPMPFTSSSRYVSEFYARTSARGSVKLSERQFELGRNTILDYADSFQEEKVAVYFKDEAGNDIPFFAVDRRLTDAERKALLSKSVDVNEDGNMYWAGARYEDWDADERAFPLENFLGAILPAGYIRESYESQLRSQRDAVGFLMKNPAFRRVVKKYGLTLHVLGDVQSQAHVYPLFLSVRKPLRVNDSASVEFLKEFKARIAKRGYALDGETSAATADEFDKRGHTLGEFLEKLEKHAAVYRHLRGIQSRAPRYIRDAKGVRVNVNDAEINGILYGDREVFPVDLEDIGPRPVIESVMRAAWTSIPDEATAVLTEMGYDGIYDDTGDSRVEGTYKDFHLDTAISRHADAHTGHKATLSVWDGRKTMVVFHPNQLKSPANNGAWSKRTDSIYKRKAEKGSAATEPEENPRYAAQETREQRTARRKSIVEAVAASRQKRGVVLSYARTVSNVAEVLLAHMLRQGVNMNYGRKSLGDRSFAKAQKMFPTEDAYVLRDAIRVAKAAAKDVLKERANVGKALQEDLKSIYDKIHRARKSDIAWDAKIAAKRALAAYSKTIADPEAYARALDYLERRKQTAQAGREGHELTQKELSQMELSPFNGYTEYKRVDAGGKEVPAHWATELWYKVKHKFRFSDRGESNTKALTTFKRTVYHEFRRAVLGSRDARLAARIVKALDDMLTGSGTNEEGVRKQANEIEDEIHAALTKTSIDDMVEEINKQTAAYGKFAIKKVEKDRNVSGLDEWFLHVFRKYSRPGVTIEEIDEKLTGLNATVSYSAAHAVEAGGKAVSSWGDDPRMLKDAQGRAALALARDFKSALMDGDAGLMQGVLTAIMARKKGGAAELDARVNARRAKALEMADALADAIETAGRNKQGEGGGRVKNTLLSQLTGSFSFKQELEDAIRFCVDTERRTKAQKVIDYLNEQIAEADIKKRKKENSDQEWLNRTIVSIWSKNKALLEKDGAVAAYNLRKEATLIMAKLSTPRKEFAKFSADGKTPLSYAQLVQIYASLRQEDVRRPVENAKAAREAMVDENGNPAEAEDELPLERRLEMFDEIEAAVGAEGIQFLDECSAKFVEEADEIDKVAMDIAGVPITLRNRDYFPVVRDFPEIMINSAKSALSYLPAVMTPRVSTTRDIDERANVFSVWLKRSAAMSHFCAYGRLHMEIGSLFGNGRFSKALKQTQGDLLAAQTAQHARDILSPNLAGEEAYAVDSAAGLLMQVAAHIALGGNLLVMLRQGTSMTATAFDAGWRKTFMAFVNFAKDPKGAWERMMRIANSAGWRARYQKDEFLTQVQLLANGGGKRAPRALLRWYMATNRWGDRIPILVMGQGLLAANEAYLRGRINPDTGKVYTEGELKERAEAMTWDTLEKTQQTSRTANMSHWQRQGGSLGRMLGQFQSTTSQFLAAEVRAFRNVIAQPKNKEAWEQWSGMMMNNHFLLPGAFWLAGLLWKLAFGDDDDNEDFASDAFHDFLVSCLLGPASGIFILGSLITSLALQNEYQRDMQVPGYSVVSRVAGSLYSVVKAAPSGDSEKLLKAVDRFTDSFAPVRDVKDFYRAVAD